MRVCCPWNSYGQFGPDQALPTKKANLPLGSPDELEAEELGGAEVVNEAIPDKTVQISC